MSTHEIQALRRGVADGAVELDELALHLEPLLWKARMTPGDEVTIKELMNDLERILFTLKPENQLKAANALLARAETFLAARGGAG